MKKIFYPLALAFLLLFNACEMFKKTADTTSNQGAMETNVITGKKWKLIELNGKKVADKVNNKEPFLLLEAAENRYSASGGCNGIGGTFTLTKMGKIKFSLGVSTMMMCPDMSAENGLKDVLSEADNYTISADGSTLSLNKARMAPLARFVAAADSKNAQSLNGTWEVDYVSGAKIAFEGLYPGKKPVIVFNVADGKATGNSSCNTFNVGFTLKGNDIKFKDAATTMMACPGEGEAVFFKTLKTVNKYDINGNTLNLIMGDIAVMRLQRK